VQNEFLENADGSAGRETDAGILERQRRPVTIPFRDIQIRDASSREVTENTGIVRLQLLIVALSDDGAGEGVQQA
jgi:hypothetical protein